MMTDDELFHGFRRRLLRETLPLGVAVTTVDIGHYICWGPEQWLFRFDPDRARVEGDDPQVAEAVERIRATL